MVFPSGFQECVIAGCDERAVCKGLCRSHYDRQRYSGSPVRKPRGRMCLCCGNVFQMERSSKRFCSPTCRKRYERRCAGLGLPTSPAVNPIIENEPLKRPERSYMVYEAFTEDDIWAKCDGVCYGCGRPVSRDVDSPDAGTPGWIVPPEDGGEASLANRAIFHYGCIRRHGSGSAVGGRDGRKAGGRDGGKRKKGGKA